MKKITGEWLSRADSRYPGDFGLLPNGKPGIAEAHEFNNAAKDIYLKVRDHLSKL